MIDILKMPYVQKVLPLVYDESLSYYELLCKVVKKLNDTIGELNEQGEDVAQLKAEMAEVKYWIDHFDVEGFAKLTGADFLGNVTTTGSMSAAQGFTGNLTGDVTGNVTGNLTGDVTGDVTGDLTGDVVGNVRGNVTGTLTGSVNGDVNGNVRGNVTGNVAGNVNGTLTGDSRGTHYGGVVGNVTGDVTGNADTATQLETARSLVVDLESTVSDLFDGSANADLGVKGVLDVAHGGTGNASVDTAPTAGSTKMVTSGGVKTALDGKQDTLTFDLAPTENSTNPVTSGGVYSAIAGAGVGVVQSVFGRQGVIVATAGDYDADQIDYDNTDSGLTATNVQDAIDEVLASGKEASDISLDTTNTRLPSSVNTVQKLAEYMYPILVTVTLTVNGAKEDSITIKDSNNNVVGTCIFASGQISGTCQIDVPVGGGTFKFISSVAKSLDGLGNDYEKNITLTDAQAQTVYVMPTVGDTTTLDKTYCPWYGNRQIYLPNTFTAHEYIATSGTQYFDTGVVPTSPIVGELEADILQATTGYLLGAYDDGKRAYILGTGSAANRIVIGYNDLTVSGGASVPITLGQTYNWKTVLKNGEQTYSKDGETVYSNTVSGELAVTNTLYFNANHENDSATQISTARYRSVKITVNNTMVRNFVPCSRIADSVVGMYDIINDVFYTNQGSGTFTFG